MEQEPKRVLFLCTGNSARSIMAEAILNRLGGAKVKALSAGSQPKGEVHPLALETLAERDHPIGELRSKSWDEFAGAAAVPIDFVVTLCDSAANEACPIWPGHPMMAHWGLPDPAAATGSETSRRAAFAEAYAILSKRIELFLKVATQPLDKPSLKSRLDEIGKTPADVS